MKKVRELALLCCLFSLAAGTNAMAAKADGPKAKFFAKYDLNHNGVIDPEEKEAIRKDYAANPEGDLKRFDKNHDGKLDDDEIAAIKPPTGSGKSNGKKNAEKKEKEDSAKPKDGAAEKPKDNADAGAKSEKKE